jgi:hypothetical protein
MAVDTSRQIDTGGEDLIVRDLFIGSTAPGQAGTKVSSSGTLSPQAGTATVPPLKLTSGTNLTTASPGVIEYDGFAFYATSQSSARQTIDTEQWLIAQADVTGGSVISATAATLFSSGASTLTLGAGQYAFEFQYYTTCSQNTSVQLQLGFSGTAVTTIAYNANGVTSTGGSSITAFGVDVWQNSSTLVTVTNSNSTATANSIICGYGTMNVSTGAGGTWIPTYSTVANSISAGALLLKAGSFMRVWGIGPASTQSVGRWS